MTDRERARQAREEAEYADFLAVEQWKGRVMAKRPFEQQGEELARLIEQLGMSKSEFGQLVARNPKWALNRCYGIVNPSTAIARAQALLAERAGTAPASASSHVEEYAAPAAVDAANLSEEELEQQDAEQEQDAIQAEAEAEARQALPEMDDALPDFECFAAKFEAPSVELLATLPLSDLERLERAIGTAKQLLCLNEDIRQLEQQRAELLAGF